MSRRLQRPANRRRSSHPSESSRRFASPADALYASVERKSGALCEHLTAVKVNARPEPHGRDLSRKRRVGQGVPTPGNPTIHRRYFGNGREGGPPHAGRHIPRPTAHRQLLIYMCCAVCALLLGGSRHHTPAGGIRHFRDAGASHPDAFGAFKLLGPASLYRHSPSARFCRPAASDLASDPYVWLRAG